MKGYKELSKRELNQIMYPTDKVQTPFGWKKVLYADFIASGRPSPAIENAIIQNIYGKYSNTHSNAGNGIFMKNQIQQVRKWIKQEYKINDSYEVLFKGSGCTGAVNFLIDCLDYSKYKTVSIYISKYEHYSNHLPWLELSKTKKNIHIHIIPLTATHEVDVDWLEAQYQEHSKGSKEEKLVITSIIHCSNLFGYFTPVEVIQKVMHRHRHPHITQYFFCDLACSAPYVQIDGKMFDAFFLSPHKFIGGVETPGLLVAKTCLFEKDHPMEPGGSCIRKTHNNHVEYSADIETRESAGTPNIIGIIKIGLCYLLKRHYQRLIHRNEACLVQTMKQYTRYFQQTYPTQFRCMEYGNDVPQLPIFSFHAAHLHYNFVVVLLNDLFGIQTRGGRACDGLLSDYILDKYHIDGFCRVSLHWTMSRQQIQTIFQAIDYIFRHGEAYKPLYRYNETDNLFYYKKNQKRTRKNIKLNTIML